MTIQLLNSEHFSQVAVEVDAATDWISQAPSSKPFFQKCYPLIIFRFGCANFFHFFHSRAYHKFPLSLPYKWNRMCVTVGFAFTMHRWTISHCCHDHCPNFHGTFRYWLVVESRRKTSRPYGECWNNKFFNTFCFLKLWSVAPFLTTHSNNHQKFHNRM